MKFEFQYVQLTGRFVSLVPLSGLHAEGLLEAGRTHSDWQYLPIPGFATIEDVNRWIAQANALLESKLHYTYVVIENDSNKVVGSTRYMNVRERDCGVEVGYSWLAPASQQSFANPEAKFLLLEHAFEHCGAIRVELKTDERNIRSQRAIEKLGATREGVLRKHMLAQHDFIRNSVLYSITDDEWPRVKTLLLSRLRHNTAR